VVASPVEVGFPPVEALESILRIGHFVIGSAVERQAEAARGLAAERGRRSGRADAGCGKPA
jgi:hypothetical protein